MATHSNIPTWEIPWTEDWWATVHGFTENQTPLSTHKKYINRYILISYKGTSLIAQLVKNLPAIWFDSWVRKIHWRRDRLPIPVYLGFPCGSAGKESACNAEDLGLIAGLGRSPGEGKGYPLRYSGLENSMDCIVHGVTKSRSQLSDFHFHFLLVIHKWLLDFKKFKPMCLNLLKKKYDSCDRMSIGFCVRTPAFYHALLFTGLKYLKNYLNSSTSTWSPEKWRFYLRVK